MASPPQMSQSGLSYFIPENAAGRRFRQCQRGGGGESEGARIRKHRRSEGVRESRGARLGAARDVRASAAVRMARCAGVSPHRPQLSAPPDICGARPCRVVRGGSDRENGRAAVSSGRRRFTPARRRVRRGVRGSGVPPRVRRDTPVVRANRIRDGVSMLRRSSWRSSPSSCPSCSASAITRLL